MLHVLHTKRDKWFHYRVWMDGSKANHCLSLFIIVYHNYQSTDLDCLIVFSVVMPPHQKSFCAAPFSKATARKPFGPWLEVLY